MVGPLKKPTWRMAWHGMALMLLGGCAPTHPPVDPEVEALVRSLNAPPGKSSEFVHDLGTVLDRGQAIRHEVTLCNLSHRRIRIVGVEAPVLVGGKVTQG